MWLGVSLSRASSLLQLAFLLAIGPALLAQSDPAARTLLLGAAVVARDIVAVGERGAILRSSDNGRTWQRVSVPASATLTAVSFAPQSQRGWAVGHDALILGTSDGGRTWTQQYQGENLQTSFLDVCALDTQGAIVVGAFGQCLATTDGGQTWTPRRPTEEDLHLNRIVASSGGSLFIAGERGLLLRSTDRGEKWMRVDSPYDGSFYGILPLGPQNLLAHGLRGRIYRSTDNGSNWTMVPNERRVLLAAGVRLRSGVIVLAGQARAFFVSRDEGQSFAPWTPGLTTAVAFLLEAPDGTLLAFGEAGVSILPAP
jgi:photosystem II stability/assembly factor-like uncharacterized protein